MAAAQRARSTTCNEGDVGPVIWLLTEEMHKGRGTALESFESQMRNMANQLK